MSVFCFCGSDTVVIDSRPGQNQRLGAVVRRRRRCMNDHRHTTYEVSAAFVDQIVQQALGMQSVREKLQDLLVSPLKKSELITKPKRIAKPKPIAKTRTITQQSKLHQCAYCGNEYAAQRSSSLYCGTACKGLDYQRRKRIGVPRALR